MTSDGNLRDRYDVNTVWIVNKDFLLENVGRQRYNVLLILRADRNMFLVRGVRTARKLLDNS